MALRQSLVYVPLPWQELQVSGPALPQLALVLPGTAPLETDVPLEWQ